MTVTKNGQSFEVETYIPTKEINWPQGYPEALKGKSIEEQMDYFRVAYSSQYTWSSYGQIDNEKFNQRTYTLEDYENKAKILFDGEFIVGIEVFNTIVLVNDGGCVYIGEDNNGAGYKTYYEYAYLCCVPKEN